MEEDKFTIDLTEYQLDVLSDVLEEATKDRLDSITVSEYEKGKKELQAMLDIRVMLQKAFAEHYADILER